MSLRDYERQKPAPYKWQCAHCHQQDTEWRDDYEMALLLGGAHLHQNHAGVAVGEDDLYVVSHSEIPPAY